MSLQSTTVRIVALASLGHRFGGFDLGDLHFRRRKYNAIKAYGQSKLCNILFVKELARRYCTPMQYTVAGRCQSLLHLISDANLKDTHQTPLAELYTIRGAVHVDLQQFCPGWQCCISIIGDSHATCVVCSCRTDGTNIEAFSLHPGSIATNLSRHMGIFGSVMNLGLSWFSKTMQQVPWITARSILASDVSRKPLPDPVIIFMDLFQTTDLFQIYSIAMSLHYMLQNQCINGQIFVCP